MMKLCQCVLLCSVMALCGCEQLISIVLPEIEAPPSVRPDKKTGAPDDVGTGPIGAGLEGEVLSRARGNLTITSFSRSKKELLALHHDHATTFYCGCTYAQDKQINLSSCGYKVRKSQKRAERVEYEHVMPASWFGRKLDAWLEGHADCVRSGRPYKGRACAERTSKLFKLMQADMYNLQPAIGEVNGDRSDADVAMLEGEPREYGRCDFEVRGGLVEPGAKVQGDVARTYFYMEWAYPGLNLISAQQRELLERWSAQDPVDDWERERARRIQKIQGNANPFIK